jgi:hypothetical protein
MRCILVSDGHLKAETCCTNCRKKIGDSYAREIGSRFIYCDYDCYRGAADAQIALRAGRSVPNTSWTASS